MDAQHARQTDMMHSQLEKLRSNKTELFSKLQTTGFYVLLEFPSDLCIFNCEGNARIMEAQINLTEESTRRVPWRSRNKYDRTVASSRGKQVTHTSTPTLLTPALARGAALLQLPAR